MGSALSILVAAMLAGCAVAPSATGVGDDASNSDPAFALPPAEAGFDYQLGGAYPPPSEVSVVERDRSDPPAQRGYDICYVNGFQTQPADSAAFVIEHPELVLHREGEPVADPGWPDEFLFDTSTPENRDALAAVVEEWIRGCADDGFDAVEIDNLDSFLRSGDALTAEDNVTLAADYARIAHDAGLAIAQKNAPQLSAQLRKRGYDFAITESCMQFTECNVYADAYDVVIDIEYTDELGVDGFAQACAESSRPATMILRDHDLVTPSDEQYHYEDCSH